MPLKITGNKRQVCTGSNPSFGLDGKEVWNLSKQNVKIGLYDLAEFILWPFEGDMAQSITIHFWNRDGRLHLKSTVAFHKPPIRKENCPS